MPSLTVTNLVKQFGEVRAVDGISFEAKDGEFITLLGPVGLRQVDDLVCDRGTRPSHGGRIQARRPGVL